MFDCPAFVAWYIGATQSGKTTAAIEHARRLRAIHRRPILSLDLAQGAKQFSGEYHERSARDVVDALWYSGDDTIWTPRNEDELEGVIRVVDDARGIILLVDEASYCLGRRGSSPAMLELLRTHAHKSVHVLLTTQHATGDIPAEAFSCSPYVYCFRNSGPLPLKMLSTYTGIDIERVPLLAPGEHYLIDPMRRVTGPHPPIQLTA